MGASAADAALVLAAFLGRFKWFGPARTVIETALRISPSDPRLLRQHIGLAAQTGDLRNLSSACQRLLAAFPDDEEAVKNAVIAELLNGHIDAARSILRSSTPPRGLRLVTDALIHPERARQERAYVARLENVDVETAYWSILDGNRVYSAEAMARALPKNVFVQGRTSPDRTALLFDLPEVSRTVDEPCVHVGGDHNYSHWIQRNLLKLALLEGTPYENLPLLVNEDLADFQRAYLEMLAIPDSRLIKVKRESLVRCRELIVPTTLVYSEKLGVGVQWLRRQLAAWLDPGPPRDLLFLSRADARIRRLLNEHELMEPLLALGFSVVTPGTLSVPEQIRAVSRARVIVGAHGAGLANLAFAPPGATVVEINNTEKAHMSDHALLAHAAGLRLQTVLSDDYDLTRPEPYLPDADFRVEVDEVLSALERLEPGLTMRA